MLRRSFRIPLVDQEEAHTGNHALVSIFSPLFLVGYTARRFVGYTIKVEHWDVESVFLFSYNLKLRSAWPQS